MVRKLRAFLLDEGGAETIEYVLVTLAILAPAALIFREMYAKVLLLMVRILRQLQP